MAEQHGASDHVAQPSSTTNVGPLCRFIPVPYYVDLHTPSLHFNITPHSPILWPAFLNGKNDEGD